MNKSFDNIIDCFNKLHDTVADIDNKLPRKIDILSDSVNTIEDKIYDLNIENVILLLLIN